MITKRADSGSSSEPSWGKTVAWLLAAVVVAFLVWVLPVVTKATPGDMAGECATEVASWAGVAVDDVAWRDVSSENFSGTAWDFRGSYPGGTWACGGPSGNRTPSQIVVYLPDGTPQVLAN